MIDLTQKNYRVGVGLEGNYYAATGGRQKCPYLETKLSAPVVVQEVLPISTSLTEMRT